MTVKKFKGVLICTDLDGTLLRDDKSISQENIDAIEYFKSEGGIFTFITGRMPFLIREMCDAARINAPFGCINGGGLYDHLSQKYIWKQELDISAIELAKYVADTVPDTTIHINTFDKIYLCRENSDMDFFRKLCGVENASKDFHEINEPIAKILFGSRKKGVIEQVADILSQHPLSEKFKLVRSEQTLYEILPKGISKASVLPILAKHLNVSPDKIIAVGDYNNDIEMLRLAKVGVAVANAHPDAKAAANYITVSNEEHAIAKIIYDIDQGILNI